MDITAFQATIDQASGLARLNRFQVFIPVAALVQNSSAISQSIHSYDEYPETNGTDWMSEEFADAAQGEVYRLTAFCDRTFLPGYQFQVGQQRIYGPSFSFPHMPQWEDVTMTFYCGADFQEKYFFEAWQYMTMDPKSNNFNYRDEYGVDINIVSYDDYDNINYVTTLVSAFPVAVYSISMAYEENNSLMKLQVTFTYKTSQSYNGANGSSVITGKQDLFNNTVGTKDSQGNFLPNTSPPGGGG